MQLVFLHGSGDCMESWQYQLDYFDNAIALNLPGHPSGDPFDSVSAYSDWLSEYLASKDFNDVVLVGHSLGGGIALQYALDHPQTLAGLVAVGSGARLRVHQDIFSLLELAANDGARLNQFLDIAYAKIDADLADTMRKRALENKVTAFINDFSACNTFDVMDRVANISTPLLAIVGSEDKLAPAKYSAFLADSVSNGQQIVIEGAEHYVHIEQSEAFNEALSHFCQAIAQEK